MLFWNRCSDPAGGRMQWANRAAAQPQRCQAGDTAAPKAQTQVGRFSLFWTAVISVRLRDQNVRTERSNAFSHVIHFQVQGSREIKKGRKKGGGRRLHLRWVQKYTFFKMLLFLSLIVIKETSSFMPKNDFLKPPSFTENSGADGEHRC